MTSPADAASRGRRAQLAWAESRDIEVDHQGYTLRLEDNLFQPLGEQTRRELAAGAGNELGEEGGRGKLQAVHASAALAVNVFDYWRNRPREPLQQAFALEEAISNIQFERPFPTGMLGTPPHLDVTLTTDSRRVIAIESKFLEVYPARTGVRPFRDTYFPASGGRWDAGKLTDCQRLADALRSGEQSYRHLDAQQLLKHALGLAHTVGDRFSLWYLWYDPAGEEGRVHRTEIEEFSRCIDPHLGFRSMTYQELIAKLEVSCGAEHSAYLSYLTARYAAAPS